MKAKPCSSKQLWGEFASGCTREHESMLIKQKVPFEIEFWLGFWCRYKTHHPGEGWGETLASRMNSDLDSDNDVDKTPKPPRITLDRCVDTKQKLLVKWFECFQIEVEKNLRLSVLSMRRLHFYTACKAGFGINPALKFLCCGNHVLEAYSGLASGGNARLTFLSGRRGHFCFDRK